MSSEEFIEHINCPSGEIRSLAYSYIFTPLRDLPSSVSDPFDFTWPTPPAGTPIEWPQK